MDPGPVRFSIVLGRDPHHRNPLALVAKMSESERNDLESGRRGGLARAADPDTTPPGIRYGTSIQRFLFFIINTWFKKSFQLYADDYEMPWIEAIHREQPSLGRIEADSENQLGVETSIKRCISSENPTLSQVDFSRTHHPILHWKKAPSQSIVLIKKSCGGRLLGPRFFTLSIRVKFYPISMVQAKAKDSSQTQENKHSPIILVFMGHHAGCLW